MLNLEFIFLSFKFNILLSQFNYNQWSRFSNCENFKARKKRNMLQLLRYRQQ